MGKSQSIFDREATALRRPLNTLDKVRVSSKYTTISCLLVLIPFFLYDYFDVGRIYDTPREIVFENIRFEVKRAPKGSEARVVIYGDGGQVFSSSCSGLESSICSKEEFWDPHPATNVLAIEISPKKGIIKKIEISRPSGRDEFANPEAENYARDYSINAYRKDWILLFISILSGVIFIISKALSRRNYGSG